MLSARAIRDVASFSRLLSSSSLKSTSDYLARPLDKTSLSQIRHLLKVHHASCKNLELKEVGGRPISSRPPGNAAVLIPLCNINGQPGILLEVRAKGLRSHSGELSFPGGRVDADDESNLHGALRETQEELGIDPQCVEILGQIGPPEYNMHGNMLVWPFVGFVHSSPSRTKPPGPALGLPHSTAASDLIFDAQPRIEGKALPDLSLPSIRAQASPDEVSDVIHLPLSYLSGNSKHLQHSLFRDAEPYWCIDVTDLLPTSTSRNLSTPDGLDSSKANFNLGTAAQRIEVWGLTGWYLNVLMRALGMETGSSNPLRLED